MSHALLPKLRIRCSYFVRVREYAWPPCASACPLVCPSLWVVGVARLRYSAPHLWAGFLARILCRARSLRSSGGSLSWKMGCASSCLLAPSSLWFFSALSRAPPVSMLPCFRVRAFVPCPLPPLLKRRCHALSRLSPTVDSRCEFDKIRVRA